MRRSFRFSPPDARLARKKKPGPKEPGLRYWPREADTITFQEGLLSVRATGGGGQMRNANAQRRSIMVRACGMQQAVRPHVSHAQNPVKAVSPNTFRECAQDQDFTTASAAPCS